MTYDGTNVCQWIDSNNNRLCICDFQKGEHFSEEQYIGKIGGTDVATIVAIK